MWERRLTVLNDMWFKCVHFIIAVKNTFYATDQILDVSMFLLVLTDPGFNSTDALSETTEMEYLRKVLFEYMMGRETKVCSFFVISHLAPDSFYFWISDPHSSLHHNKLLVDSENCILFKKNNGIRSRNLIIHDTSDVLVFYKYISLYFNTLNQTTQNHDIALIPDIGVILCWCF